MIEREYKVLCGIQFTENEIEEVLQKGNIIKFGTVYKVWKEGTKIKTKILLKKDPSKKTGFTRRGRYFVMTDKETESFIHFVKNSK